MARMISGSVRPAGAMLQDSRVGSTECTARMASYMASRWASVAACRSVPSISNRSSMASALKQLARAQAFGEGGDKSRGPLDVLERDHLNRRVHVAARNRDEARGNARSADVDDVDVRARPAPQGLHREGHLARLGALIEKLEHLRVEVHAARDDPARVTPVLGDLDQPDP